MLAGSSQLTVRLLSVSLLTVGGSGWPGGSFTSSTRTTTVLVAVSSRVAAPPVAVTSTVYSLFPPESAGRSKSGAPSSLKRNWFVLAISKSPWSAPPVTA